MKVDAFDFHLPRELIAARPAVPRDSARLLEVRADGVGDRRFTDLPRLLRPGDLLVFNDTRVIPARLRGKRATAAVEVTLHKRVDDGCWDAFARPARKLRVGDRVDFGERFAAEVAAKGEGGEVRLRFALAGDDLRAALARHGAAPLPPYIPRPHGPDARDARDYQTVYARHDGAVAAPTAGLHFTPELFAALESRGVGSAYVTLHVGAGTFLPVKVADTRDHRLHAEAGRIDAAAAEAVNATRLAGGRIVAVGTTSLRLLESAAGDDGLIAPFAGETALFITPGYRFKAVDLLLTNFHLPRSTLFMLVCAFAGLGRMHAAYAHAMKAGYRFYSYGDGSLLHRAAT
ncbi:MAG: tRNA preQ1(34) S-adenosylmethionine ribosyltransferase-isomerase QueA [Alphaproteobacteria bacterium]